MGLILSDNENLNNKFFTDHLNSIHCIDDARTCINQENHLRGMNGCSYYRWILNLVQQIQTEVVHTKAHTNQVNLSSLLNYKADHYVSTSQKCTNSLHPAPIPTYYMENFTFYRPLDSWIKSNIRTLIEHSITHSILLKLHKKHHYRMALWLYDP